MILLWLIGNNEYPILKTTNKYLFLFEKMPSIKVCKTGKCELVFDYAWYTSSRSITIFLMALHQNFTAIGKFTKRLFCLKMSFPLLNYKLYSQILVFHNKSTWGTIIMVISHVKNKIRSPWFSCFWEMAKKPRTFLFVLGERKCICEVFNVVLC